MLISGPIGDACSFVTNKLSHWSERECTRTRGAPSQAQGRDGRHGQPISVLGHLLQPNPAQPQIFGMGLRDWANFQVAGKIELFFSWKPLAHVIYTVCFLFFIDTVDSVFENVIFSHFFSFLFCKMVADSSARPAYINLTLLPPSHMSQGLLSLLQYLSCWACSQIEHHMPNCHGPGDTLTQFSLLSSKQFPKAFWVGFSPRN